MNQLGVINSLQRKSLQVQINNITNFISTF